MRRTCGRGRSRPAAALLGVVLGLLLSGCMQLEQAMTLTDDGRSGRVAMTWTLDKAFMRSVGTDTDQVEASLTGTDGRRQFEKLVTELFALRSFALDDDADYRATADDEQIEVRVRLRAPRDLATFATASTPQDPMQGAVGSPSVTRAGALRTFRAPVVRNAIFDLNAVAPLPADAPIELRVALTAPGEVVDHNGTLDGRTVHWVVTADSPTELRMSWRVDHGSRVAPVVGVAAAVAVLGVLGVVFARVRRAA